MNPNYRCSLFQISKTTNALGDDLFLDDSVSDIFADNEVFRVIKGASIRESLPRNYRETREASLQPNHQPNHNARKRSPNTSNMGDLSRAGKRQRFHEPERPIPSIERFAVIDEEDEGSGSGSEDEDVPDAEEPSQEEIEAPQEADVNGARAAEVVASPPIADAADVPKRRPGRPPKSQSKEQTPNQPTLTSEAQDRSSLIVRETPAAGNATKRKRRGRGGRKSSSAAPEPPAETRPAPFSTCPILPATAPGGDKAAPVTSASQPDAPQSLGVAKSSHMLPPPILPQRQPPRPRSPPKAVDAAHNSAPASSPNVVGDGNAAKKVRRVSFAEPEASPPIPGNTVHNHSKIIAPAPPSAKAIGTTNGDASYAVIVNVMPKSSQAEPSSVTAIEDHGDDTQQPEEQDDSASTSQNKDGNVPEGESQRGKRSASTISVYQQEKLAKKQATEEKKKLAAEKKAEKQAAKEAKAKARAEAKEAKEAKRKEKEERKLASSQKEPKVEAKVQGPMPSTSAASTKASGPIVDENDDTTMSGMADNVPAVALSSAPAPAPESVALPPSSPIVPAQTPKQTNPGPSPDKSPSEASSPGSASTSRSQRDSRSPVHFVTANSQAGSKESFPGSGQKQGTDDESESEEDSSSDEDDDDGLDSASAVKPKTPAPTTKEKADVASTQSVRSTSYIPPPSQPRFSEISPPFKGNTKEQRRQSTTPIQPPAPKIATNRSFGMDGSRASDSPAPSQSQRPAAMAHLPSLKNQTAQALAQKHAALEKIKLEGQAKAKKLHDEQVAKRKEEKVEVSEAETDSSSGDSDSDSDGSSSDSDAKKSTPKNKRLLGLKSGAAPASASKAEGKKKSRIDFGGIKKRFSLGSSLK